MPTTTTVTLGIQYTPPSSPVNSGNASFIIAASNNAQNVGQIDITTSDTSPATFVIPFGSIASPKVIMIKNQMTSDIGIRLNSAVSDNFKLPPGGQFCYTASAAPGTTPISAISIVTTATPTAIETISYWVFGD